MFIHGLHSLIKLSNIKIYNFPSQIICIGCSLKCILKVGVERSIMNESRRISCLNLTSLFALFVFLL
jgi:hypothetical protein